MILILFLAVLSFYCTDDNKLILTGEKNFPQWIKTTASFPDQTSGITFLGSDKNKRDIFLIADDVGALHYLSFMDDSITGLREIKFSDRVHRFLDDFPKKDFEEIFLDRKSGRIYVSIEGNGANYKKYAGIYELVFRNRNIFSGEITDIKKLNIKPAGKFYEYTNNNIGFEGAASDDEYFYFGLESTLLNPVLSDSTLIFIADKKNNEIVKVISTREMGIATICGLCSNENRILYGVDRNRKVLFRIRFDVNLNISSFDKVEIKTSIPGYKNLDYIASLESVAINGKYIYLVDDPWKSHFIPTNEILTRLDDETRNNFNGFIPIIYKFKLNF